MDTNQIGKVANEGEDLPTIDSASQRVEELLGTEFFLSLEEMNVFADMGVEQSDLPAVTEFLNQILQKQFPGNTGNITLGVVMYGRDPDADTTVSTPEGLKQIVLDSFGPLLLAVKFKQLAPQDQVERLTSMLAASNSDEIRDVTKDLKGSLNFEDDRGLTDMHLLLLIDINSAEVSQLLSNVVIEGQTYDLNLFLHEMFTPAELGKLTIGQLSNYVEEIKSLLENKISIEYVKDSTEAHVEIKIQGRSRGVNIKHFNRIMSFSILSCNSKEQADRIVAIGDKTVQEIVDKISLEPETEANNALKGIYRDSKILGIFRTLYQSNSEIKRRYFRAKHIPSYTRSRIINDALSLPKPGYQWDGLISLMDEFKDLDIDMVERIFDIVDRGNAHINIDWSTLSQNQVNKLIELANHLGKQGEFKKDSAMYMIANLLYVVSAWEEEIIAATLNTVEPDLLADTLKKIDEEGFEMGGNHDVAIADLDLTSLSLINKARQSLIAKDKSYAEKTRMLVPNLIMGFSKQANSPTGLVESLISELSEIRDSLPAEVVERLDKNDLLLAMDISLAYTPPLQDYEVIMKSLNFAREKLGMTDMNTRFGIWIHQMYKLVGDNPDLIPEVKLLLKVCWKSWAPGLDNNVIHQAAIINVLADEDVSVFPGLMKALRDSNVHAGIKIMILTGIYTGPSLVDIFQEHQDMRHRNLRTYLADIHTLMGIHKMKFQTSYLPPLVVTKFMMSPQGLNFDTKSMADALGLSSVIDLPGLVINRIIENRNTNKGENEPDHAENYRQLIEDGFMKLVNYEGTLEEDLSRMSNTDLPEGSTRLNDHKDTYNKLKLYYSKLKISDEEKKLLKQTITNIVSSLKREMQGQLSYIMPDFSNQNVMIRKLLFAMKQNKSVEQVVIDESLIVDLSVISHVMTGFTDNYIEVVLDDLLSVEQE